MPPEAPAASAPPSQSPGTPPAQTPTGEIKDQSLLNQGPATTEPPAKESVLTEGAKPPVEGEKKPEGEAKPGDKKAETGPPDKYELKVPEGYEVTDDVTTAFREAGLTQAAAQKMVDLHLAKTEAAAKAPYDLWQQTQEDWVKEIKADPEIGGKLDQVRATTAKAIDSLGPELAKSFREALNFTGAGNNPTFVKAFYKFAQQLTEGTHVPGGGPVINKAPGSSERPSAAAAIYPNLAK